ncbi:MAG: ketoacyl-ACP synthase III [Saprospiraceae bacterium]|nr:ketoacyl-ACP synthase III [Saprospiraceae bacterium]
MKPLHIDPHLSNACILASGSYAPEKVVPNAYFNELLGEDVDTWLRENVQIYERRWCADDESTADLVEKACVRALENAGLKADDIDLFIVATDTPEFISPSTASVVQDRLKMVNAGTFDVNTACAGFVTALDIATRYIHSDAGYRHILVVGAYAMSKYLNLSDKKTVTLFADGAGAVVVGRTHAESGYRQSKLLTRGEFNSWMGIYAGGSHQPVTHEAIDHKDHQLKFVQKIPTHINPEIWTGLVQELCERENIKPADIHHYFFTQINVNSIYQTIDKLGVDRARAATIMHYYGYTGSACIPMALDEWMKQGNIRKGEYVCFVGSGGGLAFGASLFKM